MKNLGPEELFELFKMKVQKVMIIDIDANKYNKTDDLKRIDISKDLDYKYICNEIDKLYQKESAESGILQVTFSDEKIIYIHRYGYIYHIFGKLEEKQKSNA
jgi:hypothetical protein